MGGGKNKAQRTKNNVKPSSSGRSAALLGAKVCSTVSFSSMENNVYVPALPAFSEEIDQNINPVFHIVLKKMNKKDSTTKVKALNEFGTLCRDSEKLAVEKLLPFWPRLYCMLATDSEHRVREAAHKAHKEVLSSVGRSIAPYLKQIAGAWFTSQYDTYPPAASAATASFQVAFSNNKLTEAIIFCEAEILSYISDNLLVQTPQSLANKTVSTEEMEAKYLRVIISSLNGYGFYLSKLPEEHIMKAEELNRKLLEHPKFLKYIKHSSNLIRAGWLNVIVYVCQRAPSFLSNIKKQVILAVFNIFDDKDSMCLPLVWEASIHLLNTFEDWWRYVNVEKLIYPKLWTVISNGGLNCGSSIYPMLLPFIRKIPSNLIQNKLGFYSRLFSSLDEGIKLKNIQLSIPQCDTVADCYIQFLSYVISNNIEEDFELCKSLVSEQVLHTIKLIFKDGNLQNFRRVFYSKLINLLIEWSKQERLSNLFLQLVDEVFDSVYNEYLKILELFEFDGNKIKVLILAQVDLVYAFKNIKLSTKKRHLKVTFIEDSSPECEQLSNKKSESLFYDSPSNFKSRVDDFVKKVLGSFFKKLTSSDNSSKRMFLTALSKILTIFNSKDYFDNLLLISDCENSWNGFWNKYITVWLSNKQFNMDDVSQLIFTLLIYVENEDDKEMVLCSLSQMETKKVLDWCLKKENIDYVSIKNWLSSKQIDEHIIALVSEAVNSNCDEATVAHTLVKKLLTTTNDGSILINMEVVFNALNYLCDIMNNYNNVKTKVNIDNLAELMETGLKIFEKPCARESNEKFMYNLVLQCFNFCLVNKNPTIDLLWQNYLSNHFKFDVSVIERLSIECYKLVVRVTISEKSYLEMGKLQYLVEQTLKYFTSLKKLIEAINLTDNINWFIKSAFTSYLNQQDVIENFEFILKLCSCAEIISSSSSIIDAETGLEIINSGFKGLLSSSSIIEFFVPSLFMIIFLSKISGCDRYVYDVVFNPSKEDDQHQFLIKATPLFNDYALFMGDALLRLMSLNSYRDFFGRTKLYFECNDRINDDWLDLIYILVKHLDENSCEELKNELLNRSNSKEPPAGVISTKSLFHILFNIFKLHDTPPITMIRSSDKPGKSFSDVTLVWFYRVYAFWFGCDSTLALYQYEEMVVISKLQNINLTFEEYSSLKKDIYEKLLIIKEKKSLPTFLSEFTSKEAYESVLIAQLLKTLIDKNSSMLSEANAWDFTMIAVATWISVFEKISKGDRKTYYSLPVMQLLISVCDLFKSLTMHISYLEEDLKLKTEWNDVFSADVHKGLANIWVNLSKENVDKNFMTDYPLMLVAHAQLTSIINNYLIIDGFIKEADLSDWLKICCNLIQSNITDVQLAAFHFLIKLTPRLASNTEGEDEESKYKKLEVSFKYIKEALIHVQTIVDTMLSSFKLGDTCIVKPFTDSYDYTRSYLLLWNVILSVCKKANPQLRFMYTAWIKDNKLLEYLMKTLLCLMPEEAVHSSEGCIRYIQEYYESPPSWSHFWDSKSLSHLSCYTYFGLLACLPAEVRLYWNEIDHQVANLIERLTTKYVSPLLCENELNKIRCHARSCDNMKVAVHSAVREVVAVYVVEECSIELVIQLPFNYPLGPTRVESGKCLVSTNQTRQWVMQLTLFLTHQNGSIWDGLNLWKTWIDNKFEGVEECYICFSILHVSNITQQLPRLSCQTCKKKFHSTCLYQWFMTSNKSTCPICRNLF